MIPPSILQALATQQDQQAPGIAQQILAQRFEPTLEDASRAALKNFTSMAYGQPSSVSGQDFADERMAQSMNALKSMTMLQKLSQPEGLPQGYRMNPATGQAELIPGVDPSFAKKADPFAMPMPVILPNGQPGFASKNEVTQPGYQPINNNPNLTGKKPLPAAALKLQQEALDAIGTANNIDADLGSVIDNINSKKLSLGPIDNTTSKVLN